ncbi:MAG: beta-lactamase family protein [Myxococcales bacterium]|nr:beta-lactamase family protein [Myxococcales bacterium]
MDAELDDSLLADARRGVDEGELAGAAALVWRRGRVEYAGAVGQRDLQTGQPATRDTVFRIASLSKPVTALAALRLHDEGRFALDEPISRVAPELARARVLPRPDAPLEQAALAGRAITFRDLLTHRAGLGYAELLTGPIAEAYAGLGPHIDNPAAPDEWIAALGELPLVDEPGRRFRYGHASDLLGFLVARLDGAPLGEVLRRRVFEPLGMVDTGFVVPADRRHRRAGLCGFDERGRLTPLTVAPGGHALAERPPDMTYESGGQGLWSTVDDFQAFASALIGDSRGARLLRPETRRLMTTNQLTAAQRDAATMFGQPLFDGHGFGMGVAVVMEPARADPSRGRGGVGTVGWPGAYGAWWQADPTNDVVMVFLCHVMADLRQMARGVGLGAWAASAGFHAAATRAFSLGALSGALSGAR